MRRVAVHMFVHVCDLVGCLDHAQLAQELAFVWRSGESLVMFWLWTLPGDQVGVTFRYHKRLRRAVT